MEMGPIRLHLLIQWGYVSGTNNLFVSNGAECIREISGGFVSTISCINNPVYSQNSGLAIDAQNNIYFTDGNIGKVRVIRNGILSDFTNGVGFSEFEWPALQLQLFMSREHLF